LSKPRYTKKLFNLSRSQIRVSTIEQDDDEHEGLGMRGA